MRNKHKYHTGERGIGQIARWCVDHTEDCAVAVECMGERRANALSIKWEHPNLSVEEFAQIEHSGLISARGETNRGPRASVIH